LLLAGGALRITICWFTVRFVATAWEGEGGEWKGVRRRRQIGMFTAPPPAEKAAAKGWVLSMCRNNKGGSW
jgi:hypothetical protein